MNNTPFFLPKLISNCMLVWKYPNFYWGFVEKHVTEQMSLLQ